MIEQDHQIASNNQMFLLVPDTPAEFMSPAQMDMYYLCLPFLYGMTHVSKVGSVFSTLAVSLERYFAVCRPLWIRIRRCHPATYIVIVLVFAFGFNIPKFLEFEVSLSFLSVLIACCCRSRDKISANRNAPMLYEWLHLVL